MYKKDWQIRGIYDDCASILAGICDAMPKDIDEAIEGLNVKKYYELMESSKRSRPKDMKYIGNTEKKIIEENIINLKSIYHKYSLTNECELDGMLEDLHFN